MNQRNTKMFGRVICFILSFILILSTSAFALELSTNDPWPTFRHDNMNTGQATELSGPHNPDIVISEIANIGSSPDKPIASPVINQDGTIFVGSGSTFYAINETNPAKGWEYSVGANKDIFNAVLATSDGNNEYVVFTTRDNETLDLKVYMQDTSTNTSPSPNLPYNLVDPQYANNLITQAKKNHQQITPLIVDDKIFVGYDRRVFAIKADGQVYGPAGFSYVFFTGNPVASRDNNGKAGIFGGVTNNALSCYGRGESYYANNETLINGQATMSIDFDIPDEIANKAHPLSSFVNGSNGNLEGKVFFTSPNGYIFHSSDYGEYPDDRKHFDLRVNGAASDTGFNAVTFMNEGTVPYDIFSSLAINDETETIYVAGYKKTNQGVLYALQVADNADFVKKWNTPLEVSGIILSSPIIDKDGYIYVGTNTGHFYCIRDKNNSRTASDNAEIVWHKEFKSPILSSPALNANGELIVITQDGKVHKISNNNAKPYWENNEANIEITEGYANISSPDKDSDIWSNASELTISWGAAQDDVEVTAYTIQIKNVDNNNSPESLFGVSDGTTSKTINYYGGSGKNIKVRIVAHDGTNQTFSNPVYINLDYEKPVISADTPQTVGVPITVSGTAADTLNTVEKVELKYNQQTVPVDDISDDGSFSGTFDDYAIPPTYIDIIAYDSVGNTKTKTVLLLAEETIPEILPQIKINNMTINSPDQIRYINNSTIALNWQAKDDLSYIDSSKISIIRGTGNELLLEDQNGIAELANPSLQKTFTYSYLAPAFNHPISQTETISAPDSDYTVLFSAEDALGNESDEITRKIVIDTQAPKVAYSSPIDNFTYYTNNINVTGKIIDSIIDDSDTPAINPLNYIKNYRIKIETVVPEGSRQSAEEIYNETYPVYSSRPSHEEDAFPNDYDFNYSLSDLNLEDGTYKCTVIAYDEVNNESAPYTRTFTINNDEVDPIITLTTDPIHNTVQPEFTINAEDPSGIQQILITVAEGINESGNFTNIKTTEYVYEKGTEEAAETITAFNDTYQLQAGLVNGTYVAKARAIDLANNTVWSETATFAINTSTTLSLDSINFVPSSNGYTSVAPTINMVTTHGNPIKQYIIFAFNKGEANLVINEETGEIEIEGLLFPTQTTEEASFSLAENELTLGQAGEKGFMIGVEDIAGNKANTGAEIKVETTAPTIVSSDFPTGDVPNVNFSLSAQDNEAGIGSITIELTGPSTPPLITSNYAGENSVEFDCPVEYLLDGTYHYILTVKDKVNNSTVTEGDFTLLAVNTPNNLNISKNGSEIELNWDGFLKEDEKYILFRKTNQTNWVPYVNDLEQSNYVISELPENITYYYRVAITNGVTSSPPAPQTAMLCHQYLASMQNTQLDYPGSQTTIGAIGQDIANSLENATNGEIYIQFQHEGQTKHYDLFFLNGQWIEQHPYNADIAINNLDSLTIGVNKTVNWYIVGEVI